MVQRNTPGHRAAFHMCENRTLNLSSPEIVSFGNNMPDAGHSRLRRRASVLAGQLAQALCAPAARLVGPEPQETAVIGPDSATGAEIDHAGLPAIGRKGHTCRKIDWPAFHEGDAVTRQQSAEPG